MPRVTIHDVTRERATSVAIDAVMRTMHTHVARYEPTRPQRRCTRRCSQEHDVTMRYSTDEEFTRSVRSHARCAFAVAAAARAGAAYA